MAAPPGEAATPSLSPRPPAGKGLSQPPARPFRVQRAGGYLLVDGEEADVRLFHGEEEHQRAAPAADAGRAATAMHEGTVNTGRGREHRVTRLSRAGRGPPVRSSVPTLPPTGVDNTLRTRCCSGDCNTLTVDFKLVLTRRQDAAPADTLGNREKQQRENSPGRCGSAGRATSRRQRVPGPIPGQAQASGAGSDPS